LPQPAVLESHDGRPHYHGRLILEHGPERIESGWWDGQDVSRDYYLAASPTGERLWIFRERRGARGWYLHGLFA
jgi:protein ImuB